jgi:outer membrane protein assembly factor BamB
MVGLLFGPCLYVTAADPPPSSAKELAAHLIQQTRTRRGVVSMLGAEPELLAQFAGSTEALIHVREPDGDWLAAAQQRAAEGELGIDRVVVERGGVNKLPYADNLLDAVITVHAGSDRLRDLNPREVLRVLRPRGTALIGNALTTTGPDAELEPLAAAAREAGATDVELIEDAHGHWLRFHKPAMAGADDWSHWEHSPDNNPVSTDQAIKAPYMTQFLANPLYIGMPSITTAASGRTFLAIGHISHHRREWSGLNRLIARNGYNGTVLWERKLPEGYLVHRSAFVATDDVFYMLDGDGCWLLDTESGSELGRLEVAELKGEWKWMAKINNVLYVMSGKKEQGVKTVLGDREFGGWSWADLSPGYYGQFPFGFGDTLAAIDLESCEPLWVHREESNLDARSLAIRDDKIYFLSPDRHLRALSQETGEVLWTNSDRQVRELIAEPGKGLTSTPGFKTMCLLVATPKALVIQGQTRMNVVAVSTENGYVLWTKRKITNNPNAVYVDDKLILGVGERGSNVVVDPVSGNVEEDLKFLKTACTRLTASSDSLFCRGEGTLRYDFKTKKVLIDGAARPACNDGALPANGMLYIGPWQCDCNLSLIGSLARCSAGEFRFDHEATDEERLEVFAGEDWQPELTIDESEWTTYRGDVSRSSSTTTKVGLSADPLWRFRPPETSTPTAPVTAGNLVFWADESGHLRAVDVEDGGLRWQYATQAPIKSPPTVWQGRVYIGSGDGYVTCLDAANGTRLWRFRAAPIERHIMIYERLNSTWPVNSGVTIHDGVAHFAAGIIDHDGTYVYAVDAKSGKLKWHNNSSGHVNPELRKGVSVQGNMSVLGDQLLLAGGNQISPAPFDRESGKLRGKPLQQGQPKANNGRFVGAFRDSAALVGGRVLYSAPDNVATKGSFVFYTDRGAYTLNYGGVPPAWNDDTTVLVNFKHGSITCFDTDRVLEQLQGDTVRPSDRRPRFQNLTALLQEANATRWETNLGQPNRFEAISLVVSPTAIVGVVRYQEKTRSQPTWYLIGLDVNKGNQLFRKQLRGNPLPGGLLVDRDGRIVVTMVDGQQICFSTQG